MVLFFLACCLFPQERGGSSSIDRDLIRSCVSIYIAMGDASISGMRIHLSLSSFSLILLARVIFASYIHHIT